MTPPPRSSQDLLSFAKTVSGSLDGCPESSDKLELRETGMRPGCPRSLAVGLARRDEILGEVQRASQKEERNGVAWAGGGEEGPMLDYAACRT